ncbi:ribulokinase [Alicyclobacillaceae bacterium I2511]|nr:ribulokinase [Alicyclobacillaceae bacterium I2511]
MTYSIGVDFGTESGRIVILNLDTGEESDSTVVAYSHGVMDDTLYTSGEKLPPDWALQDPSDYIDVLEQGIPEALRKAHVRPEQVIGLGIDFTSCTVLPVKSDGTPLCKLSEFKLRPHAWVKLWKHHAAQPIADKINGVASNLGAPFLSRYGGKISSEWYFPKLIEMYEEDRELYEATDAFVEATDWVVWYLTGMERRNSCTAGYKAMWSEEGGLPGREFFQQINSEFVYPEEKLGTRFYPLGTRAGYLRPELADSLGLPATVAVAVGNVDAHVSVPGLGVNTPGSLVMVVGTSICHLTLTELEVRLPGITGVVKDGILPGLYGYEAGQAAVGDMLAWYVEQAVPAEYHRFAQELGLSIYEYLEQRAVEIQPGSSGLIALDWWNGNRSILGDADLSGVLFGISLTTTPAEIYRALLESIAFGTKRILENFVEHGIPLQELIATGGIAWKSPLLMQIYADVCGLPVRVYDSQEVPARGAALFGAVAAGSEVGGVATISEASERLRPLLQAEYTPVSTVQQAYRRLYAVYRNLYGLLGEQQAGLLHELKDLRREVWSSTPDNV